MWVTQYRHDVLDNFRGYTDSKNNEKHIFYDSLRRKVFVNDPARRWMWCAYETAHAMVAGNIGDVLGYNQRWAEPGAKWMYAQLKRNGGPKMWLFRQEIGLMVLTLVALETASAATPPPYLNYQGRLTDASGQPIANGGYALTFTLWSQPIGGPAPVWGPQVFDGASGVGHGSIVPVVDGFFNVVLGPEDTSARPLLGALSGLLYLEVQVASNPAILPRQQLLSVPFAANGNPPGTIIAFAGAPDKIPAGYLICDGAAVSRAQHAALFEVLGTTWGAPDPETFNVPDLRGRFVRGWADGAAADPDRSSRVALFPGGNSGDAVGSYQNAGTARPDNLRVSMEGNHNHDNAATSPAGTGTTGGSHGPGNSPNPYGYYPLLPAGNHVHTLTGWDNDTRPTNAYVIYLIKT